MADQHDATFLCPLCHAHKPTAVATPFSLLHDDLAAQALEVSPHLDSEALICEECTAKLHGDYFEEVLAEEVGELDALEKEVIESLEEEELITDNINEEFEDKLTFGQHIADKVAAIGGSWAFISGFGAVLLIWIVINSLLALRREAFDPYPFILLNLCLSCLAAIQAPIIMMSQNRQAAKDRMRAEQDYQVNLKAELQIHHIHEMLDHLMTRQLEHMLKIQHTQAELLHQLARETAISNAEKPQ